MMIKEKLKHCSIFIALIIGQTIQAQNNIKPAIQEFEKENYKGVIEYIVPQMNKLERDAKANYYLGASYVASNTNISEGLRRLKFAQVKGFVANSYFYLGRAYQLSYEFESAIQAFDRFLKTARDTKLISQAQMWSNECNNSLPLPSVVSTSQCHPSPASYDPKESHQMPLSSQYPDISVLCHNR